MPEHKKEVNYFNHYYHKGAAWYRHFFIEGVRSGKVCGEASPEYVTSSDALTRITQDCPDTKLIVLLRNPWKRSVAHYGHLIRTRNIAPNFDEAIKEHVQIIEWSHYRQQLQPVESIFRDGKLKIIIFEEMVQEPMAALHDIGMFIGVKNLHALQPASHDTYSFYEPRFKRLYVLARKCSDGLRHLGLDRLVNFRKETIKKTFGVKASEKPVITSEQEMHLKNLLEDDVKYVERLLGRRLDVWQ